MDRMGLDINPQVDMNINGGVTDLYNYLKDYTTVVLQPNRVGNRNILTQEMVSGENIKYVIKYNYNLDGKNIVFNANTILEIDGGSLTNGGIVGNNTLLININELPEEDILINIVKSGTWRASIAERMDNFGADEEDLTKVNDKIMLKDKEYEPLENSGLGRVYLRKNLVKVYSPWMYIPVGNKVYLLYSKNNAIYAVYDSSTENGLGLKNNLVYEMEDYSLSDILAIVGDHILGYTAAGGVYTITLPDNTTITSTELNNTEILRYKEGGNLEKNLLTQRMLNKANTIYHIQYDFELNGDITVPANCVLEFDGGSISGGNIALNNTIIKARTKVFNDITFTGALNGQGESLWFVNNGEDITSALQNLVSVCNNVHINDGTFYLSDPVILKDNLKIHGEGINTLLKIDTDGLRERGINSMFFFTNYSNPSNDWFYNYRTDPSLEGAIVNQNIEISGLSFDTNRADLISYNFNTNAFWCPIRLEGVSNARISNCYFKDYSIKTNYGYNDCISLYDCEKIVVEKCISTQFDLIQCMNGKYCKFCDNIMVDRVSSTIELVGGEGSIIERNTLLGSVCDGSSAIGVNSPKCVVSKNFIENHPIKMGHGVGGEVTSENPYGLIFTGDDGIVSDNYLIGDDVAIVSDSAIGLRIVNNYVKGAHNSNDNVTVNTALLEFSGQSRNNGSILIEGNTLEHPEGTTDIAHRVILLAFFNGNAVIQNNRIKGGGNNTAGHKGVISATYSNLTCKNNEIVCEDNRIPTIYAFQCKEAVVCDNVLYNTGFYICAENIKISNNNIHADYENVLFYRQTSRKVVLHNNLLANASRSGNCLRIRRDNNVPVDQWQDPAFNRNFFDIQGNQGAMYFDDSSLNIIKNGTKDAFATATDIANANSLILGGFFLCLDSTNKKLVIWNGTTWVDATGTPV